MILPNATYSAASVFLHGDTSGHSHPCGLAERCHSSIAAFGLAIRYSRCFTASLCSWLPTSSHAQGSSWSADAASWQHRATSKAERRTRRGTSTEGAAVFSIGVSIFFSLECYRGRALAPSVCALNRSTKDISEASPSCGEAARCDPPEYPLCVTRQRIYPAMHRHQLAELQATH